MKSLILASAALVLATSASAFDPYVGVERETKSDLNTVYVGASHAMGDLTLSAQLDASMNDGSRGNLRQVNLDASYAVTPKLDVYLENDLDKDWKRTETKIGAKWKF
jgi:opacity protein-like surface antigen